MSYKHELVEELKDEIVELGKIEVGTDKYKVGADGVAKLASAITEIEKLENQKTETELRLQQMEAENELRLREMEDEKKDRRVKNAIALGTTILSTGIGVWAYKSSMKYEVDGVFPTTEGGRSILRNLLNKVFK